MAKSQEITAAEAAELDLEGRAFLHLQGMTVTRGMVSRLALHADYWELHLRDVAYFNRKERSWTLKRAEDVYDSQLSDSAFELGRDGLLRIGGYGMETYVAPATPEIQRSPWAEYRWPKIDGIRRDDLLRPTDP